MNHALIVEEDRESAEIMATAMSHRGFTVATVHSLRDARRELKADEPDVVMLNLVLPDGNGLELLDNKMILDTCELVLITGQASVEGALQAMRCGAVDYLVKPISLSQVHGMMGRLKSARPAPALAAPRMAAAGQFDLLWGQSAAMLRVYEQISRVAPTSVTSLIVGESGTGKELVAQAIHRMSPRCNHPFLAVNCGAISSQLIESELFGHEKGSFTGAFKQHPGFFERARGGSLFLDEITEMPIELQVKLLRVLETGTFMRVGSTELHETDVRIMAATNCQPAQAVADGKLREDLYYRLNVFPIELPPLRARGDDIQLLAERFLNELAVAENEQKVFSPAALAHMATYRWPGNVRELRNAVQRAFVMESGSVIGCEWLPTASPCLSAWSAAGRSAGAAASSHASPHPHPLMNDAGDDVITIAPGVSLATLERSLIEATLRHFNGHKEKTAAVLGISLKTLYNRLKEYSLAGGPRMQTSGTPLHPDA